MSVNEKFLRFKERFQRLAVQNLSTYFRWIYVSDSILGPHWQHIRGLDELNRSTFLHFYLSPTKQSEWLPANFLRRKASLFERISQ
jgi:hypothetical protein